MLGRIMVVWLGLTRVANADPDAAMRAHQLSQEARSAAQRGDCMRAHQLEAEVAQLDDAVYRGTFATDDVIAVCFARGWRKPPALRPPGLTDPDPGPPTRSGLVIGGSVGLGVGVQAEGRLGWMATPWLALFGTVISGVPLTDDGGNFHLIGGGVRLYPARIFFLDARVGYARSVLFGLDEEDTDRRHGIGGAFSLGFETTALLPVGLEASLGLTTTGNAGALVFSVGASLY